MERIAILTAILALIVPCGAAEIRVEADGSGDYPTIQAAIDATLNGDTVVVGDGVYRGSGNRDISFKGKAITVRSENGASNCIIDCNGTEAERHRGFVFESGEDANSVLQGFTITGGFGPMERVDPPILMMDCSMGGGILCWKSNPVISNCILYDNTVDQGWYGAMGAGISCYYAPSVVIRNCTVVGNINLDTTGAHFGAVDSWGANTIVENSIVWRNRQVNSYAEAAQVSGTVSVSYSCIQSLDALGGNCNIGDDPCFADPCSSDYHLKSEAGRWDPDSGTWVTDSVTSPCVGTGDPYSEWSSTYCQIINMGAYGGTDEASKTGLSYCYCGEDFGEWVSVGMPESWCYPRQCHGDADGSDEPYGNLILHLTTYVGNNDIAILVAGYKRPYTNPVECPWIAADFDHAEEDYGNPLMHLKARVGNNDVAILVAHYKSYVPADCLQTP